MVGLSIVLESLKGSGGGSGSGSGGGGGGGGGSDASNKKHSQVINKTTKNIMITRASSHLSPVSTLHPPPYSSGSFPCVGSSFLEQCFLCAQKLLPGKDIYMYKGDRAFCSVECRCKQIFMDEEDTLKKGNNCSLAAIRSAASSSSSSSSSSASSSRSSSPGASRYRKATRNGFVH